MKRKKQYGYITQVVFYSFVGLVILSIIINEINKAIIQTIDILEKVPHFMDPL